MSKSIFRVIPIIFSLLLLAQYPAHAQLGKVGSKVLKKILKKGGKEVAEEGAEKAAKEITLDAAEHYAAKRAAKELVEGTASKYLSKDAIKYTEGQMGKKMSEKALKVAEQSTAALRVAAHQGALTTGKEIAGKEAVKYFRPAIVEESGGHLARRELSKSAELKAAEKARIKPSSPSRSLKEAEEKAMKVTAKSRNEYLQNLIKAKKEAYNLTENQEKEILKRAMKDESFAKLLRSAPNKAIELWLRDDFLLKNPAVKSLIEKMGKQLSMSLDDLAFEFMKDGGVKVTWKAFPESSMIVKGKHIYANAGSTVANGNMNQFLNHLIPGYKYTVDNAITYTIDKYGRKVIVEGDLNALEGIQRNTTRNKDVQNRVRGEGVPTDEGSHLISREMGGANEYINEVPFDGKVQGNGEWRRMEEYINKARSDGKQVHIKIVPKFKGTSMRPYKIRVEVTINGVKEIFEIRNPIP